VTAAAVLFQCLCTFALADVLSSSIGNGASGSYNLIAGRIYTGGVRISGNVTINGNGAILEKRTTEFIDIAAGGRLTLRNVTVRLAAGQTQAGSYGLRVLSGGVLTVSDSVLRDTSIGVLFVGASSGSQLSGCRFENLSQNGILIQNGASPEIVSCDFIVRAGTTAIQSTNGSPGIGACDFVDATSGTGTAPAGILIQGPSYAAGARDISYNVFTNMSPAISLSAATGTAMSPIVMGNDFRFPNRPTGLAIRTTNAEPYIVANSFSGGASAIELTGTDSYAQLPLGANRAAIEGNTASGQRAGTAFNLNDSIPDIRGNILVDTSTAIYLKRSRRNVVIAGNYLRSVGLDTNNINVQQPIGPAVTLGEGSVAWIADNYISGFVGGIQVIQSSNATLERNEVTRCFNGGILIESGAAATLKDNFSHTNRSDDYFVANATANFYGNRSLNCGQYPGNVGGASAFGFVSGAVVNEFIGNSGDNAKDVLVGVHAGARVGRFHGNTLRRTGSAGLFVESGAVIQSARGNLFQSRKDLVSVSGNSNANCLLYGNAFLDGGFALNVNAANCVGVSLLHSIIDDGFISPIAVSNNAVVPFQRNAMGLNVAGIDTRTNPWTRYPAINTAGTGRLAMKFNKIEAMSGIGLAGNNPTGWYSTSDRDWWAHPNGPMPMGQGLSTLAVSITNPLSAPPATILNSGPLSGQAGSTRSWIASNGGPGNTGGEFAIIVNPARPLDYDYVVASRATGVSELIAQPTSPVYQFGLFTMVMSYNVWNKGSGSALIRLIPGYMPAGKTAAQARLTRFDAVSNSWQTVASRVQSFNVGGGQTHDWLIFDWNGTEAQEPNGLFAIQFP